MSASVENCSSPVQRGAASVVHNMELFFQADLAFLLYWVKSFASVYQHPVQVIALVLLLEAPNVVDETRVVSVPFIVCAWEFYRQH